MQSQPALFLWGPMTFLPQAACIDAALYVYFMAQGLDVYKKYKKVD